MREEEAEFTEKRGKHSRQTEKYIHTHKEKVRGEDKGGKE